MPVEFNGLLGTLFCSPNVALYHPDIYGNALADYRDGGFDGKRDIGVLGGSSWTDRMVATDPRDEWKRSLALSIDRAYDEFGLRTELSVIGGSENGADTKEKRQSLISDAVEVVRPRQDKVINVEGYNEGDNKFPRQELRDTGEWLNAQLPNLGAPTSYSHDNTGDASKALYENLNCRALTCHVDRNTAGDGSVYEPIWNFLEAANIPHAPPARISDEPVGPYSSGYSEMDPERIIAAAVLAWMRGAIYTYHPGPGKRLGGAWDAGAMPATLHETPGWQPTCDGFKAMRRLLPPGMVNWRDWNGHWQDSPVRTVNGNGPYDTGQVFRGRIVAEGDKRVALYLWVRSNFELETDRELLQVDLWGNVIRPVSGRFRADPSRPINLYVAL